MRGVTYVASNADLQGCAAAPEVDEVLLEPRRLARLGRLERVEVERLAQGALDLGLRPVLVWDTLVPEDEYAVLVQQFADWNLAGFAAVRVRDLGAALWVQEHTDREIHLSAEVGCHNLESVRALVDAFGERLGRLLLSCELSESELLAMIDAVDVPCEILGAGRIPIFYSPRPLLQAAGLGDGEEDAGERGGDRLQEWIEIRAASEDSGSRPFPTVQSAAGTMMFYDRDLFLLDRMDALRAAGLAAVRLDLRHLGDEAHAAAGIVELTNALANGDADPKVHWPNRTLAPFFKANKTTAQFKRLKSPLHEQRDERCLAQVLAFERDRYHTFRVLRDFAPEEVGGIVLPTGEERAVDGLSFRDLTGADLAECRSGQVVTTRWLRGVPTAALLRSGTPNVDGFPDRPEGG